MAKLPCEITATTVFRVEPVPDLELKGDVAFPLRAYVLKCSHNCWYVGLSHQSKIRERIDEQFAADVQKGSSWFCAKHPPMQVYCVHPVRSYAMEAAFFYGMQEVLCLSDLSKLGGWTYTSNNPSPLDVMKLRRQYEVKSNVISSSPNSMARSRLNPRTRLLTV